MLLKELVNGLPRNFGGMGRFLLLFDCGRHCSAWSSAKMLAISVASVFETDDRIVRTSYRFRPTALIILVL